jgi:hexosaminidase
MTQPVATSSSPRLAPARRRPVRRLVGVALASGLALLATAPAAPAAAAGSCHPDARALRVTFGSVDHSLAPAAWFRSRVSLRNGDDCALAGDWRLFFTSVRQPLGVYPEDDPLGQGGRQQLAEQGLTVRRADEAQSGDFYVLEPTADFEPIGPGQTRHITMDFELWALLKTDAPAGFHISFADGPPRWVPARAVFDPSDERQTKVFPGDVRPVETPATRFAQNTVPRLELDLADRILPRPLSVDEGRGRFKLDGRTRISHSLALRREAAYLESALGDVLAGDEVRASRHRGDAEVTLALDGRLDAEGYKLSVTRDGVRIVGADRAGVLYGIQTLRQLIPAGAYADAASGHARRSVSIPQARIADAPLFGYRGMGIDVARHFESKETIKKFIDLMAFLKLNRLHFHLTDDEGWRLEIPGLPELTSYAGRRGHDLDEDTMLHMAMGSGNDLFPDDNVFGKAPNERVANLGRTPTYQGFEQATLNFVGKGSGFYTVADYEEILRYATERHVQVIPEFDFPAHARAAVQAMEHRYERLAGTDPAAAGQYRLIDPDDTSVHRSVQYYTDNLANPCIESTYRFLSKVVTEVRAMHDAAGAPLSMINLGGDEPPGPDRWQGSPACDANPETAGKTDDELMDLFFTRWHEIARSVAPRTAGWEDVILAGTGTLELENFVPLPWQNVWGWGREQEAYKFANAGVPVILAHATNLYMDLAYNKDPDEPGYYWANFVDEEKTFTYQPFDVYANATHDRWGAPFTPDPNWERLTPEGRRNILGIEAQLWGENGKAPEIREYQAFPKLLGVAERAWNRNTPTPAEMPQAWQVFSNTLGQATFPLLSWYQPVGLEGTGVNYRIPLPGGRIEGGVLRANVRNPGLTIEYSLDGQRWLTYQRPVRVGDSAWLRTKAPDGRTSRVARVSG